MTTEQFGEIQQEFKPGWGTIVAGIIIGLLLIGGGCGILYSSINGVIKNNYTLPLWEDKNKKGWCWGAVGFYSAIGIGMIIGAFLLLRWMRSLATFRILVKQNGFSVINKKSTLAFGWDDILSVQEIHIYERLPVVTGVAKYALPKMKSTRFKVTMNQGDPIVIDGDTIKGYKKLAQIIKQETDRRNIPWEIIEQH